MLNATYPAGADLINHHLNTGNANVEYHFGNRLSAAMGWFLTSGTADGTLYAPASVTGSANGSPRSTGYIGNFSWWPKQNIDLGVQYTGYARFNGGSTNYDGSGRNASDNNTTYRHQEPRMERSTPQPPSLAARMEAPEARAISATSPGGQSRISTWPFSTPAMRASTEEAQTTTEAGAMPAITIRPICWRGSSSEKRSADNCYGKAIRDSQLGSPSQFMLLH